MIERIPKVLAGVLACCLCAGPALARSEPRRPAETITPAWSAYCDLDGDGMRDSVRVDVDGRSPGSYDVIVRVGGSESKYFAGALPDRFWIADVDSTDRRKEIAVWDEGPSDDYRASFFWFDGKQVRPMGTVPGYDPVTDGSGIVQGEERGRVLHTWYHPAAYRLTRDHRLELVRMRYCPMGTLVRLLVDLPLSLDPRPQARKTVARAGTWAVIVRTDDVEWCELETSDRVRGWFRVAGNSINGRNAEEVFDGLFFAD
jgi:hypothetical protein